MRRSMTRACAAGLGLVGAAASASGADSALGSSAGIAAARVASAEPDVFSTGGLDGDRKQAIDENKFHVVYATATWCPPCKQMKRTTWVDGSVTEWLEANAVVTPLDVDEFQSDARRLRVRAMPTMMLFRGSTEIGRTVGYQGPSDFRTWLESTTGRGVPAGGESEEVAPRASVQDKLTQAAEAERAGRLDEAAEAYGWLWDAMRRDRADDEMRRGSLAESIGRLIDRHEPAREVFIERRDAIGSQLPPTDADEGTLLDWIALNGLVGDDARTVEWVGRSVDDRASLRFMRQQAGVLRPILTSADAWDEAAQVVSNPFAQARLELMELKRAQRSTGETGLDDDTRAALADLYAIAETIGRGGVAERVAAIILRTEDTPELRRALVARAIDAGVTGASLGTLIEDDGSDEAQALREQLDG